jgi:formamidopyrimidine-DNA glycosylase
VPEILEIEFYRRHAETVVGRRIAEVLADDAWYLKEGLDAETLRAALLGYEISAARRRGKLLLLDTVLPGAGSAALRGADGPVLGLRFGMTGRLVVDDRATLDDLIHSSNREERAWDRFGLGFADGGHLRIRDPRRLGGVLLDPDEERLGPDALTVTLGELRRALAGSRAPLKARLMDQRRIAGLGNLLVDEILWRGGLDPAREAGGLDDRELRRLHRHVRSSLERLLDQGGSHTGELQAERHRDGVCPRDGTPLQRRTIGGRTTYSCPAHQV